MARHPSDREDLLRDATAYVNRVQLLVTSEADALEVFIGFRPGGSASFYFDQDPVYHFNATGKLRRAFVDDRILKAESGKLVSWNRTHRANEVVMVRTELLPDQQEAFIHRLNDRLADLQTRLASNDYRVVGEVQRESDISVIDLAITFMAKRKEVEIADSPGVHG